MTGTRRSIVLAAVAVAACAAATLVLAVQLTRTRVVFQSDGVLEFNFVQQVDHNFDALGHAIADRLIAPPGPAREAAEAAWRERLDILYSALVSIDRRWAGSLLDDPDANRSVDRMRAFVDRMDTGLASDRFRDPDWLRARMAEARALSGDAYDAGTLMYQTKSALRDRVGERLDRMGLGLWLSGGGFALAGLVLVVLLSLASRRAARLLQETGEARRQLEVAHDELSDGDTARKSQNRFLAQATHDLRQPLQALQYYLAALDAHVVSDRGREILTQITRSTGAAQRLLVELLDISKLDAGVLEARRAPTDLDELLGRLRDASMPEAQVRSLELHVQRTDAWVDTDGSLLARVLGNLVSNALAYTREGRIDVTVRHDAAGHVIVGVADSGVGIPRTEREAIFDEYYRLDGPDRDPERGIGIGLAIVRRLTRLLDIPIHVDSEIGRGTTFELTLPAVTAPTDADAVRAAAPSAAGNAVPATLAGLMVLVIDDEPDVLDGVATLLAQQGCTVIAAATADEALARLIEHGAVPDLVVADYRLSDGRTGVEAIERVREEFNEEVPALVVTGDTAPERLREAAASGLPLLHKPVDATRLFEAMRATTGQVA